MLILKHLCLQGSYIWPNYLVFLYYRHNWCWWVAKCKLRQSMVKEMRKLPNPPKFAHAAEDCGTFCKQYTGAEDNAIHKGKVVQLENEKRWANKFCIIYIAKRTLSNNKDWFYIFTFWSVHNLLFFFVSAPYQNHFRVLI